MQRSTRFTRTTRVLPVVLTLVVVTLAVAGAFGVSTVVAQDDGAPVPPAAFYGNVTVDGEPAPVGTEIVAYVDGERRGSIVTDERGTYGGSNALDEKLTVNGTRADEGATVTFRVDGERVDRTATWQPGSVTRLDLGEAAGDQPDGDVGTGDGVGAETTTDDDTAGADSDADETDVRTTSDGQAGFGPVVFLLAVVLLARLQGP